MTTNAQLGAAIRELLDECNSCGKDEIVGDLAMKLLHTMKDTSMPDHTKDLSHFEIDESTMGIIDNLKISLGADSLSDVLCKSVALARVIVNLADENGTVSFLNGGKIQTLSLRE